MIYLLTIYILSAIIVATHIVRSTLKNPFTYIGSSRKRALIGMLICVLCPLFNTWITLEVVWLSLKQKPVKGTPMEFPPPTVTVMNNDINSLYP